jgi:hypothetical protein
VATWVKEVKRTKNKGEFMATVALPTIGIQMTHRVVEAEKRVELFFVQPKTFSVGDAQFTIVQASLVDQLQRNAANMDQGTVELVSGAIAAAKVMLKEIVNKSLVQAVAQVTEKAKAKYQGYTVVMDPTSYEQELTHKVSLYLELSIGNQYGTLASVGIAKLLAPNSPVFITKADLRSEMLASDLPSLQGTSLGANSVQALALVADEGKKA